MSDDNVMTRSDSERNRSQPSDGTSVIRRTLVERGLRPASNPGSADGQSSTISAIATIARKHQDEQRELQELNSKFAVYLDRVHYLETFNQRLSSDLNHLRQTWGGDAAQLQTVYGPQLQTLRNGIDDALRDQALQELHLKRHQYDLWQIQQQIATLDADSDVRRLNFLKQELNASNLELDTLSKQFDQRSIELNNLRKAMDSLLQELSGLKNELDNHQLERLMLENELQTIREHAAFQSAIYRAQRDEILTLNTPVLDVSGFYRAELARAISDIRQDFEVLSQSQVHELEEYYRVKTDQVRQEIASENERKRLLALEGGVESMDTNLLTSSLRDHQSDLISLQTENRQLQSQFDAIASDFERIQEENQRERQAYDHEISQIRNGINDKQETIDTILQNNVSLRFEMSTYRRLLDSEDQRLSRIERGEQYPALSSLKSKATVTAPTSNRSQHASPIRVGSDLETKKMTVQKTARGAISIESVDLETDSVILVNEKYSGNEHSFRNWTIRRQIDQQPEILYQFPSTFALKPRQTIRIFSKQSSHATKSTGDSLVADQIETWGIGRKMVTRLIDDNNGEKAIITQVFQ